MISFFTSLLQRFRSKEGEAEELLLNALNDISDQFQNEASICFPTIRKQVLDILSMSKKQGILRQSIQDTTPEGRILHMIAAICFDRIGTGRYHVYRGALSHEGNSLRSIYLIAINQLEKRSVMPPEEAEVSRVSMNEIVKETG